MTLLRTAQSLIASSAGVRGIKHLLIVVIGLGLVSGCQLHPDRTVRETAAPAWAGSLRGSGLAGFVLTEQLMRRSTTMITATNALGILKLDRLDGLEEADASRLVEDGIMGLEALYANALSPYPGDISNTVITDAAFRPKKVSDGKWNAFLVYANDRFGYGVGTTAQASYKSLLFWRFSNRAGELTKVRLFVPSSTRDEVLEHWLRSIRSD